MCIIITIQIGSNFKRSRITCKPCRIVAEVSKHCLVWSFKLSRQAATHSRLQYETLKIIATKGNAIWIRSDMAS